MEQQHPSSNPSGAPSSQARYELQACIGQGAMGEVFRSHDRLTGNMVALKRARQWAQPDPAAAPPSAGLQRTRTGSISVERAAAPGRSSPGAAAVRPPLQSDLAREFALLASLQHPYIVRALDYGLDPEQRPFFSMELVAPGLPLDQAAQELPVPRRICMLLQVLQALSYLHRRGVVHRDLKPANVLSSAGPQGPQVKLVDFGLAVPVQQAAQAANRVAGSMGYLAPEILRGAPASAATDLFAVGVMTHELLLGEHPLAPRSRLERLHGFVGSAPIFTHDPRLSPALSRVLRRALCRSPAERYDDALVFARELADAAPRPLAAAAWEADQIGSARPLHRPGAADGAMAPLGGELAQQLDCLPLASP